MKKTLFALLLFGACYGLFSFAVWHLTDGFSIHHIQSDLSYSPRWEVENPDDQTAHHLLAQNFYYIGKGSQCYVFESEDHDVVLKFFRYPRYRLHPLVRCFSTPAFLAKQNAQKQKEKQRKLEALLQSCTLAYRDLKEESGLVYLHLNKTQHLKQTVVLYDMLKRPHPINIDDYEFMIQKKGEHLLPYLSRLLDQGKRKEAQAALSDLAALLSRRVQKGIEDDDAVIHKNAGFCGKKAVFLDVGSFVRKPLSDEYILWNQTGKLRTWLRSRDPELTRYFEHILAWRTKTTISTPNQISLLIKGVENTVDTREPGQTPDLLRRKVSKTPLPKQGIRLR